MRKYLLIGVSAFVLGAGAMAYVSPIAQANNAPKTKTYKMLELFGDVLGTVEDQYVTEVDDKKLIEAALDGMLTSLDPHSGYLAPDATRTCRTPPAVSTAAWAWKSPAKTAS
jgi:carboxyl-terminal processing protease